MYHDTTTAVLFPGQGSQEPGMGRDLAEASADAMALWKRAETISGVPLREIYWDGDETAMADTRNLQPALTVVNLALWQHVAGRLRPACVAGHSLGEYSALAAAGAIAADAAIELVALRGRLMAEADPSGAGGMAAILKLSLADVEDVVREARDATGECLIVANYNTPAQFVVSGTKAAVADAATRVKDRKGRAVSLAVSGAFHSPLMDEAARELAKALARVTWNRPRYAVYCNVTASAQTDGASLAEIMPRQMTSSVRWIETVYAQWNDGVRNWVEVGPKGVLTKMVKPILSAGGVADDAYTVAGIANLEQARAFCA